MVKESESDFQSWVIDLARLRGWRVAHFRAAMTAKGWRTPVQADGAGFPDLVLVRDRVIYAELKGTNGRIRPEQLEWLNALDGANAESYMWRPEDRDRIEEVLR